MNPEAIDTPLMRQYWEIKKNHRDAILFFRLGDFYEMFFDDAETASKILDLTLTARDKSAENPIPLCGIPHHSAAGYISKLLESGRKVAICEQVEDPKAVKGIVRREVVRVITPGLRTDLEGLPATETNALVAVYPDPHETGLAWIDVASGEFRVTSFESFIDAESEISRLSPREVLVPEGNLPPQVEAWMMAYGLGMKEARFEKIPAWVFDGAAKKLAERFSVATLDGFGVSGAAVPAAFALLHYVEIHNRTAVPHVNPPKPYSVDHFVHLDAPTREHLELFHSKGRPQGERSLLGVLNETQTSMGTRKLREWIHFPLRDAAEINARLDAVEELSRNAELRERLLAELAHVYDLERLVGRIASRRANALDLVAMRSTLSKVVEIRALVSEAKSKNMAALLGEMDPHASLQSLLDRGLADNPPFATNEGGMIRDGFDPSLDELRKIGSSGRAWVAQLEAEERKRTGISSLKVGYNRVFGYYIEITRANISRTPADYERKQTLANAERFITPALKEQEAKILGAEEKIAALELELFEKLRSAVGEATRSLQKLAHALAQVDLYGSFGRVASRYRYCRPRVDNADRISITAGRHPVVERYLGDQPFVPNDILLDHAERQMIVLTGPNMAGKSTIMRQVALITLMAQVGSFVPAEAAEIGVVDRIFTRVGASDDLSGGRSTFMVEMSETANILRNATEKSLILLDEIGRGTSTFDGLSIAWAVAEDLHDRVGAKTIFATHYHELTDLARTKSRVKNMNVSVKEWGDKIVFLRTLSDGAVNRSYGIEVARLAGVVPSVIDRAREILANLERGELDAAGKPTLAGSRSQTPQTDQLALFRRS